MTIESEIRHREFPNGLVLLAEPMPGVQSAAFSFLVPAGIAHEPSRSPALATMLAEWVTRGAGDLDSREWLTALDFLGVNHGIGAHAVHTSATAASLGRNLIPSLELFGDVFLRPRFDRDEIEPIRALCLQSLQSLEDDPGSKVMLELRKRHFPDPWGRPSPGTRDGFEGASPEALIEFFERSYRPNGAILAVAGAIDWPALSDAVERLFGDWPTRPETVLHEETVGPSMEHIDQETQQTQIAMAFPTVTVSDPDYYRARATAAILGGYTSARLFTEVREKRGLCYTVYASYEALKDRAAITCYAGSSPDRAQETLDVTLAELNRLAQDGIEAAELDMMRAGLKSSLIMQQESSMGRSSSLAADWYHLGRVRSLEEISAALDALTPDAVSEYASRMPLDALTLVTLGPKPLKLPR